jgi:hypothetical protein
MALLGHAPVAELSPLSGVQRKLSPETSKGGSWRKAAVGHNADVTHAQQQLLLYSVGAQQQRFRDREADRLGGFEIDD